MSTLATTNIKHPSSASNNIVLDASGNVVLQAGSASTPALQPSGDTNTGIFFPAADTIAFAEGGVESARIDSSGRLLVGTSTSATAGDAQYAKVQIRGNTFSANEWGTLALMRDSAASTGLAAGTFLGGITFADSIGERFGTIHCAADATTGSNDYPGRLVFSVTADGASSPTERYRLDSSGRLLIGATAVVSGADANGRVQVSQDIASNTCILVAENTASSGNLSCIRARLRNSSPNSIFSAFLQCDDSTTNRLTLRSDGGLANYSANNANLSDRNAKKDISSAADTWDCIKDWEIVNYRYKDQPDDADLNLGVIAQQVAESCPEVITVFQEAKEATEDQPAQEERLGVKEQQMYWMAIKALQEAMERIETLEAAVTALQLS